MYDAKLYDKNSDNNDNHYNTLIERSYFKGKFKNCNAFDVNCYCNSFNDLYMNSNEDLL